MSINKPAFTKLYNECCDIIQQSTDNNIFNKKNKLDKAYQKLCELKDAELQEFYSIVFELKSYQFIKDSGIHIVASNDSKGGPDFNSEFGYLECVAVTKGEIGTEGRKYVDKILAGRLNRHKSEIPRISSAIKDKKDKYSKYINNKVIDITKPRIIVVNTSVFANQFQSSSCIEDTMQILYAIGSEYLLYDTRRKTFVHYHNRQNRQYDKIGKKSNITDIELNYFGQDEYKEISAVILVCNSIFEEINKNYFKIFLNPNANCPINKTKIFQFDYFSLKNENDDGYAVFGWNKDNQAN